MHAPPLMPSLAIVIASFLWGLYWIPMRALQDVGFVGAWPSLVLNALVVLALLPGALWLWRRFAAAPLDLLLSGLAIGTALSLYGISLNLTDVVRAILLFYLSPAWSTVIGLIWLGERLNWRRVAALVLGLGGLMVVLGSEGTLPVPHNPGDWLALISGFAWSIGSTRIFVGKADGAYETSVAFACGTVVMTALFIGLFPAEIMGATPAVSALSEGAVILFISVFVLMVPTLLLTVWGARRLPPATVGILLLGDIVVAVASAAILLPEEPFGTREIIGTVLIMAAGLMELLPRRARKCRHLLEQQRDARQ